MVVKYEYYHSDVKKVDKKYMQYIEDMSNTIYLSSLSIAEINKYKIISVDRKFKLYDCELL